MKNTIGVLRSKGGSGEYWACSHFAINNSKTGCKTIIVRQHDDPKYDPFTPIGKLEALEEVGPTLEDLSMASGQEMSNIQRDWEQMDAGSLRAIVQKNPQHLHIFTRGTSSAVDLTTFRNSITQFAHTYVTVDSRVKYSVKHAESLLDHISPSERKKCSVFCWFKQYLDTEIIYDFQIFDYEEWRFFLSSRDLAVD